MGHVVSVIVILENTKELHQGPPELFFFVIKIIGQECAQIGSSFSKANVPKHILTIFPFHCPQMESMFFSDKSLVIVGRYISIHLLRQWTQQSNVCFNVVYIVVITYSRTS